jgi:hypothetical protein
MRRYGHANAQGAFQGANELPLTVGDATARECL